MYFLGGIAKGLKKAVKGVSRTIKKIAKSPIGKAALLGCYWLWYRPVHQFGGQALFE
jgi:argininosuccinate lyase